MINLISDTVTKPTPDMLAYMLQAHVGDDVFGEDPSVQQLQTKMAQMFGMEAGLFCPSGTMTNQIALKVHTQALDEVICDHYSHIYQYESAGYALISSISLQPLIGINGKITAQQIAQAVKPSYDWLSKSKLVVLESTCNKGGGGYYTLPEIEEIRQVCDRFGLKLHLDGARLFNALVETREDPKRYGQLFDTISLCFSKGLGAPVGSILLGSRSDILLAKRFRKVLGGGMRQSGYLAAACSYAVDHHWDRMKVDHERAKRVEGILLGCGFVAGVSPVFTNIVIFHVREDLTADGILSILHEKGVSASAFGPKSIRFVFHLDITDSQFEALCGLLEGLKNL